MTCTDKQYWVVTATAKRELQGEALLWYSSLSDGIDHVPCSELPASTQPPVSSEPKKEPELVASLLANKTALVQCQTRPTTLLPPVRAPERYLLQNGQKRLFQGVAVYDQYVKTYPNVKVYSQVDCALLRLVPDRPPLANDTQVAEAEPPLVENIEPEKGATEAVRLQDVYVIPAPSPPKAGLYRIAAPSGRELARQSTAEGLVGTVPQGSGDLWNIEELYITDVANGRLLQPDRRN